MKTKTYFCLSIKDGRYKKEHSVQIMDILYTPQIRLWRKSLITIREEVYTVISFSDQIVWSPEEGQYILERTIMMKS